MRKLTYEVKITGKRGAIKCDTYKQMVEKKKTLEQNGFAVTVKQILTPINA